MCLLELHLVAILAEATHSTHATAHTASLIHTSTHWIAIIKASKGIWLEALLLLLLLLLHTSKWLRTCLSKAGCAHLRLLLTHHIIALHAELRITSTKLIILLETWEVASHGLEWLLLLILLLLLLLRLRLPKSLHQTSLALRTTTHRTHHAVEGGVFVISGVCV